MAFETLPLPAGGNFDQSNDWALRTSPSQSLPIARKCRHRNPIGEFVNCPDQSASGKVINRDVIVLVVDSHQPAIRRNHNVKISTWLSRTASFSRIDVKLFP